VLLEGCEVDAGARVLGSVLSPGASVEGGSMIEGVVAAANERLGG
jgi:tetrahydrodipicolinate N-succinyltransferase